MLKDYFMSYEEREKQRNITRTRIWPIYLRLKKEFPTELKAQLSFADDCVTVIRYWIYLSNNASVADTHKAIKFVALFSGVTVKKELRKDTGHFYWCACINKEDFFGKYQELIMIEHPHPMNCIVKPVKKEITVYESECL